MNLNPRDFALAASLETNIGKDIEKVRSLLKDKDVIITSGKYKDRKAKIKRVYCDGSIRVFAPPYSLKNPSQFLNDSEARHLRRLSEIKIID